MQIFFLVSMCMLNTLYSVEENKYSMKIFEKVMSSAPVCWYSKFIVGPLMHKTFQPGEEPASEEFEKFGKYAQSIIGIKKYRRVPIKKMSLEFSDVHGIHASTDHTALYVNEDELAKLPAVYRWFSSLHEASHHKFNHGVLPFIVVPLACSLMFFDMPLKFLTPRNLNESVKILRTMLNSALLYYGTQKILLNGSRYIEYHADIHALIHLNCYKCAEIVAKTRGESSERKERGYLTQSEIMIIADRYRSKNTLCEYHIKKSNAAIQQ